MPLAAATTLRRPDAIIVPTARTGVQYGRMVRLAESFGCPLVLLGSGQRVARDVQRLGLRADVVILDLPAWDVPAIPSFETTHLLVGTPFERFTDTAAKRNLALLLSNVAGWSRIFFHEDDIALEDPTDVRRAVGLLDDYDAAGLAIGGFPDGSVANHAYLELGGQQRFIPVSGALAVSPCSRKSFFPQVYNEDLLYMMDASGPFRVAVTGRAIQEPYDPFLDPRRAISEEFGETVAVGLHRIVQDGRRPRDADEAYWRTAIQDRHALLCDLLDRLRCSSTHDAAQKERMSASLHAARDVLATLSPELCTSFVDAWLRDRRLWEAHLHQLPHDLPIDDALAELGVAINSPDLTCISAPRTLS